MVSDRTSIHSTAEHSSIKLLAKLITCCNQPCAFWKQRKCCARTTVRSHIAAENLDATRICVLQNARENIEPLPIDARFSLPRQGTNLSWAVLHHATRFFYKWSGRPDEQGVYTAAQLPGRAPLEGPGRERAVRSSPRQSRFLSCKSIIYTYLKSAPWCRAPRFQRTNEGQGDTLLWQYTRRTSNCTVIWSSPTHMRPQILQRLTKAITPRPRRGGQTSADPGAHQSNTRGAAGGQPFASQT